MNLSNLNYFDWFLIAIVVFSMLMALRTGLVRAIFGLLGLIGGFQLAAWNYALVGEWIGASRIKMSVPTERILGFIVVVIAVTVLMEFLGRMFQKILRQVGLGPLDRILGMAFGFARGCLVGIAVLMLATNLAPQSEALTRSLITPYLFAVAHDVSFLVPQYLQQLMVDGTIDFKHGPPHWINGR